MTSLTESSVADSSELYARAARRDPVAWDELYRTHEGPLYGYVYHRVGRDRSLADDVFHDAFLKAVEKIGQFDSSRGTFAAWLTGIARNELRGLRRSRQDVPLTHAPADSAPEAPAGDQHELVNLAMTTLSPRHQQALALKYHQGRSLEAIAEQWGTTPAAVGSLLHRARQAFREAYARLNPGGDR